VRPPGRGDHGRIDQADRVRLVTKRELAVQGEALRDPRVDELVAHELRGGDLAGQVVADRCRCDDEQNQPGESAARRAHERDQARADWILIVSAVTSSPGCERRRARRKVVGSRTP
jgi:hypothetical protein